MPEIILYSLVFAGAYAGVSIFRKWSLKNKILDVPNERSSHTQPTPRGGGLVIVLIVLFAYVASSKLSNRNLSGSYLFGASIIALISWLDDLFTISSVWRLLAQSLAALIVIYSLGYFSDFYLPFYGNLNSDMFGLIITFLWIVWLTNAFNFMDGIDGIAGLQAFTAGVGWMISGKILGIQTVSVLGGILAFSSLGFLLHNWQPAKVFMGDVGSAFLGFSFAILSLIAWRERNATDSNSPFIILISFSIIWLFLFDAIYTFLRRLLNGEKVWQAHREHIYQKLVVSGYSHRFVSLLYGAGNVLTIIVIIFTLNRKGNFETILTVYLSMQTVGLLGILYFSKKKNFLVD